MGKRILIAEHNQTLATSLVRLLRSRTFEASHQSDGVGALRAIAAAPPDLLLLDLELPDIDGMELLRKLRRSTHTSSLAVIILSGAHKKEQHHQATRALGVEYHIEKPFKAGAIITAIEQLLGPATRPICQHLRDAFQKWFFGQLVLTWQETSRTLDFLHGAPVSLRPGFACQDLGDYLHKSGLISSAEYDYYATAGGHRPESLVQLGCLTPAGLLQARLDYLQSELEIAFGAPPAGADWQPLAGSAPPEVITLNVPNLFYLGFRRFPGPAAKHIVARFISQHPVPHDDFYHHINFLESTNDDQQLLHRMDGRTTLTCCLDNELDPTPLLLTLLSLNMLKFSREPVNPSPASPMPVRTLFNQFDNEADIGSPEILESFADVVDDTGAGPPARLGLPWPHRAARQHSAPGKIWPRPYRLCARV